MSVQIIINDLNPEKIIKALQHCGFEIKNEPRHIYNGFLNTTNLKLEGLMVGQLQPCASNGYNATLIINTGWISTKNLIKLIETLGEMKAL